MGEILHFSSFNLKAADKYPYFPVQEPSLPGDVDFLLECMGEAGVNGALIVQPINHKFNQSLVTRSVESRSFFHCPEEVPNQIFGCCLANPAEDGSGVKQLEDLVLKDGYQAVRFNPYLWPSGQQCPEEVPNQIFGCCLANPAEDGSGVKQLEDLVLKDGYQAVRFNPYLWPSGQQMTNDVGKAMFSRAGELGVPVGFMCMKGLSLHVAEIEKLCVEFPSTVVMLDHMAFCKPPINDDEITVFSELLKLSRFPQVALIFNPYGLRVRFNLLIFAVTSHSLFLNVGIKEPKKQSLVANQVPLSSSE